MPWKESSKMSSRLEFVMLASAQGANIRALCRAFGISPQTGYTLLARYREEGADGLKERSRRPHSSPRRSSTELEKKVVDLHDTHPFWGPYKLVELLHDVPIKPHPNTVAAILRRHGKQVLATTDVQSSATKRFEHEAPNLLWQMDFKGHFPLTDPSAGRCYPLTVLDDHSRYSICLAACSAETGDQVKQALIAAFRKYGLPQRFSCDNGNPWGTPKQNGITKFEVWLLRQGIKVGHSRPMHPQTQGKAERFHRTLKRELLERQGFNSLLACQSALDKWRDEYNLIRPHEALGQKPPISRYTPSARPYAEVPPDVEYEPGECVRKVRKGGYISYLNRQIFVSEGLMGEPVAIRPSDVDGLMNVIFCTRKVAEIDLRIAG